MNKKVVVVKKHARIRRRRRIALACAEEYNRLGYDVSIFVCEASNLEQFLNKFNLKIIANLDSFPIVYRQILINLSFLFSPLIFHCSSYIARKFSNDDLVHVHESRARF